MLLSTEDIFSPPTSEKQTNKVLLDFAGNEVFTLTISESDVTLSLNREKKKIPFFLFMM